MLLSRVRARHWCRRRLKATVVIVVTAFSLQQGGIAQTTTNDSQLSPINVPVTGAGDQLQIDQILNGSVTSSPAHQPPPALPQDLKSGGVPELPPEVKDHEKNKTINLGPLHTGPLIQIAALNPLRLDGNYNQPVTLRDVLLYTLRNTLPIRINQQTYDVQHYNFFGTLAGFLPSFISNDTITHNHIYPHAESDSRVYTQTLNAPFFQGGRILYSTLAQMYRMRAAHSQFNTSINDALLNAYNGYYNLLLQRALLQIRIKAVEVDKEQLRLNEQLFYAGTGTRFAVMQSETQLALDQQSLVQQQVAVRLAAILLAYNMNMTLACNLIPVEGDVSEASLVDLSMNIDDLLSLAIVHRPELRQYENLRMAAARAVQTATAAYYPTLQYNISQQASSTTSNQASLGSSSTGSLSGAGVFTGLFYTSSEAFNLNWSLTNMGLSTAANILAARATSRQSLLQANQVLLQIGQQVRTDYLNMLTAREQIDVTATGVASSTEELRLANLRLQMGVGTNLELIQAERDYITALINQAQAIIASNEAQAQLLHDTGVISLDTLTAGYKRTIGSTGSTTR